jgi:ABC-2 type transport system permease protein
MNPTTHWATTVRILTQLRRDRRAMFIILVIPALITVLFHATLSLQGPGPDGLTPYDRLGIFQIAVIPCAVMFPIAAITMRRERAGGTLDRLFTTPMSKLDLLAGYGTAFSLGALAQAVIVTLVAYRVTDLSCVLTAVLGVALGLFFSAFAETEFQAVQFAPVVLVPQLFLAGVFIPRDEMPGWLHSFSDVLPLTYVVDALQQISTNTEATPQMWRDIGVVVAFIVAAVLGGAVTLRRQEA